tara:strand:- start:16053 stop:16565 length:513 start_codon:yes stop_codon:yes gene_type:complete
MKERESKLSHEYLLEILEYFPDTGIFIWKVKLGQRIYVGKEAGGIDTSNGRYYITINKTQYFRSRLAWFYVHGIWPKNEIDHRNRVKDDDRIENLREASRLENMWNRIYKTKKDKHLPKGVTITYGNKFRVMLNHEGKKKYLGLFINLEDAIKARDSFELIHRKFLYEET